jgi:hypothetical protein
MVTDFNLAEEEGATDDVKSNELEGLGHIYGISVSFEDMEGLLSNLGVIAALTLSFCVGLFPTIPMEEACLGNYAYMLRMSDSHGKSAIIQFLDNAGFDDSNLPSLPSMGGLSVRQALLDAPLMTDGGSEGNTWSRRMDAVFHLTKNVDGIVDWANAYSPESSLSGRVFFQSSLSLLLVSLSLFGALTLYCALVVSDAREDTTGKTLKIFSRVSLPLILIYYLMLLVSLVLFFIALCNLIGIRNTSFDSFKLYRNVSLLGLMVPLASITLGLSIYAWYFSRKYYTATITNKAK